MRTREGRASTTRTWSGTGLRPLREGPLAGLRSPQACARSDGPLRGPATEEGRARSTQGTGVTHHVPHHRDPAPARAVRRGVGPVPVAGTRCEAGADLAAVPVLSF